MTLHEQLNNLAEQESEISVTISFNTHRTHPDNRQDGILLKNLVSEAKKSIEDKFDKKKALFVLNQLDKLYDKIDISQNLESIHIFVNKEDTTIIRSTWPVENNKITIGNRFSITPLLKMANRSYHYAIVLLTQAETKLFYAINDRIVNEIFNDDFPFTNSLQIRDAERKSDARNVDNKISEYFNHVDKALVELYNETNRYYVVVSLEENYTTLLQVADRSNIYIGHSPINNNEVAPHELAKQAWAVVSKVQQEQRAADIERMMMGVSQGLVLTDINEIYQASLDGNAELLIVHEDFQQAENPSFDYDMISQMAWSVRSKGGKVVFTQQEQLKDLGEIAVLKRY